MVNAFFVIEGVTRKGILSLKFVKIKFCGENIFCMFIVFLLLVHTISFIRNPHQLISKSISHRNILLYFKRMCQHACFLITK